MKFLLSSSGRMRLRNGKLALVSAAAAPEVPIGTGATVLTLTDIDKNMRPYQRDAAGGYDMLVAGTSDGTAPVQARAIDADTGAVVVDWSTVATPADGAYAGRLRCPGRIQAYKLEVRDSVNTNLKQTGVNRFYVGAHFIWWGQSNAVEFPKGTYKFPLGGKGSLEYSGGTFKRSGKILDTYLPNQLSTLNGNTRNTYPGSPPQQTGAYIGDGLVYLQNVLSEALGCAVCITVSALGGQPLSYWATGAAGWTNLLALLAEIGGDAEGAILYQGEADAGNAATTIASYKSQLAARQAQFHAAIPGRNATNFKFGLVSLGSTNAGSSYTLAMDKVRVAQVDFANTTPGAFLFAANHDAVTSDGIHVKGASFAHLGAAGARTVSALYGHGPSGAGPRVVSATRSGAAIALNVQHAGGTALLDGAGGTGAALTGFRVYDGANPATISATAITSPTTIQLTLSAVPSGVVTVDYGLTPAPHAADQISSQVDPVWASAVYDNVTLVNQDRGCILQPFAAITVTGG